VAKYLILYNREACVGAFACTAIAPKDWAYGKDEKADLKRATLNKSTGLWERVIDEEDLAGNQASAEACPVRAITIKKIADTSSKKRS